MRFFLLLLVTSMSLVAVASADDGEIPDWARGVKIIYSLDNPNCTKVVAVSDPAVWKVIPGREGEGYLQLEYDRKKYTSTYKPKHRSPIHIALLKPCMFKDFVMDVELMSTTEPYDHQDLCLFFGFESPEKYYYVHISKAADMNAHNVFIVNEDARKNIAKKTTKGIEWKKDTWHTVRIVRQASSGTIEVYFDDLTRPIMTAEDKTFQAGYVGFGSFDDTGRFRRVTVYSDHLIAGKQADFFKPLRK
jgi:hypothetical protein